MGGLTRENGSSKSSPCEPSATTSTNNTNTTDNNNNNNDIMIQNRVITNYNNKLFKGLTRFFRCSSSELYFSGYRF